MNITGTISYAESSIRKIIINEETPATRFNASNLFFPVLGKKNSKSANSKRNELKIYVVSGCPAINRVVNAKIANTMSRAFPVIIALSYVKKSTGASA